MSAYDRGVRIALYVQPGARQTQLAGVYQDRLKIKIQARPVDGKANEAVINFFAKAFHRPKSSISIVSGETSRQKLIELHGLDLAAVVEFLSKHI